VSFKAGKELLAVKKRSRVKKRGFVVNSEKVSGTFFVV
jgi:hypothetical protein